MPGWILLIPQINTSSVFTSVWSSTEKSVWEILEKVFFILLKLFSSEFAAQLRIRGHLRNEWTLRDRYLHISINELKPNNFQPITQRRVNMLATRIFRYFFSSKELFSLSKPDSSLHVHYSWFCIPIFIILNANQLACMWSYRSSITRPVSDVTTNRGEENTGFNVLQIRKRRRRRIRKRKKKVFTAH